MDTHLPGPGWRGEELELPTGQETLTALRDGEGGGEGVGRVGGCWEGGGNGNFYNLINFEKKFCMFLSCKVIVRSKSFSQ